LGFFTANTGAREAGGNRRWPFMHRKIGSVE
jgi:hypothetical protein